MAAQVCELLTTRCREMRDPRGRSHPRRASDRAVLRRRCRERKRVIDPRGPNADVDEYAHRGEDGARNGNRRRDGCGHHRRTAAAVRAGALVVMRGRGRVLMGRSRVLHSGHGMARVGMMRRHRDLRVQAMRRARAQRAGLQPDEAEPDREDHRARAPGPMPPHHLERRLRQVWEQGKNLLPCPAVPIFESRKSAVDSRSRRSSYE